MHPYKSEAIADNVWGSLGLLGYDAGCIVVMAGSIDVHRAVQKRRDPNSPRRGDHLSPHPRKSPAHDPRLPFLAHTLPLSFEYLANILRCAVFWGNINDGT